MTIFAVFILGCLKLATNSGIYEIEKKRNDNKTGKIKSSKGKQKEE